MGMTIWLSSAQVFLEISVVAAIPFANGQNYQTRLVRPLLRAVGESAGQTIQLDITDRFCEDDLEEKKGRHPQRPMMGFSNGTPWNIGSI